jgi:hypothetical protein
MNLQRITKKNIQTFMKAVGKMVKNDATFYVTGGTTAVLLGFRNGTIDIDIAGNMDELFAFIPALKEEFQINIEMAKPTDFVPSLPGECDRHIMIVSYGKVRFMHFDPYAQAFSKIVRAHATDIADVKALAKEKIVDLKKLVDMITKLPDCDFEKYPRLNRAAVEATVQSFVESHT